MLPNVYADAIEAVLSTLWCFLLDPQVTCAAHLAATGLPGGNCFLPSQETHVDGGYILPSLEKKNQ